MTVIDDLRDEHARAVGIGVPSVVDFESGRIRSSVNIPLEDVPLRELLTERVGMPGLRRQRRVVRRARRGVRRRPLHLPRPRDVHDRHRRRRRARCSAGGCTAGATGAAPEIGHMIIGLDLTDGAPEDPGEHPAARLAGDARLRQGAGPAGARGRGGGPGLVPRPAAERGRRGHRPRLRRRGQGGRRGVAAVPADPRRAARGRDRQRHQPLRPARGRDRRRRLHRGRPAARARRERRVQVRAAGGGDQDEDPRSRATARARACSARR